MASVKALVAFAFLGSIGFLFLFLSCALPSYDNWYPLIVLLFYVLAPIPNLISRRYSDGLNGASSARDFTYFLTTGIVLSAFALPILLARAPIDEPTIEAGAACLVMAANVIMFLTIFGFFMAFDNEDPLGYSNW